MWPWTACRCTSRILEQRSCAYSSPLSLRRTGLGRKSSWLCLARIPTTYVAHWIVVFLMMMSFQTEHLPLRFSQQHNRFRDIAWAETFDSASCFSQISNIGFITVHGLNEGHISPIFPDSKCPRFAWWRHQMEPFPALLALCAGNSTVTNEFPSQRPVTRSFDSFFDLINAWVNNC